MTEDEYKDMHKRAVLAGTARRLGLLERVPAMLKRRHWSGDGAFEAVIIAAVVCKKIGASGTTFRRPSGADSVGDLWAPDEQTLTAGKIVERLDLFHLLV